uniref:Uncharacterized protein n=1 Tax=viral metagenome TaxID=1070528 RepID=A0A6H1ZYM3_9ZZZZ
MEMVSYWKYKSAVQAKITKSKSGSIVMQLEGEKYPFPTFPRGHLLFGPLSKLKHEIKNQIFNESWAKLEAGIDRKEIIVDIKSKLFNDITKLAEPLKYDMLPPRSMTPAVKEIHRAWTKISGNSVLKDYTIFLFQEDDAYRFRLMDMFEFFNPNAWWKIMTKKSMIRDFKKAMEIVEHCEVVGDMKERQRLWRRIFMLMLEDKELSDKFYAFCKELKWGKVFLTKGDRFHFRGKYYKADYRLFDY